VLAHEAKLKTQNSRLRRPALRRRLRQGEGFGGQAKLKTTTKNLKSEDKKIIKDLNRLIKRTTSLLDEYRFDLAAEELYHFIWHRFADEYVESVKPRLSLSKDLTLKTESSEDAKVALTVLVTVFTNCLKLLHPFIPFVTEEIWRKFPRKYDDPLIISKWPEAV